MDHFSGKNIANLSFNHCNLTNSVTGFWFLHSLFQTSSPLWKSVQLV